tara:strand:+ start:2257 stop:2517 length:261 start_codon:yes stop_codon:yes gene_type:complete
VDTVDSEAEVSGKSWIRIVFIFSVVLIVIGLVLDDTMASSDPGSFPLPSLEDLIGVSMIVIGGLMFLITGFIISLRVLKCLLVKNS